MQNIAQSFLKSAFLVLIAALIIPSSAHATRFGNQFVEFELPARWKCGLEGAEWVCQSEDDAKKRDAIIVLAAKLKGDQDTLEKYQDYIKAPRTVTLPGGKTTKSDPKYAKNITINAHLWVDSLHLTSEIPDFFTRYLATVEKDIAVLVTYSVNKGKYADYQKQFDDMVASIKVFRKAGGINAKTSADLFAMKSVPTQPGGIFPGAMDVSTKSAGKKPPADSGGGAMGLILLLAAGGGGFVLWKKKKQGG